MKICLKDRIEKILTFPLNVFFVTVVFSLFWLYLAPMLQMDFFLSKASADTASGITLPRWPHEESDLRPDPDLIFGRLPNGFGYVLMVNHNPKGRVSMHLDVLVGSFNEREKERGLAHFLEHMQFNGSTHFKPGELVKYFQRIGMQFGPDANAHTSFDETVYDILLSKGDAKNISDGLLVMRDFADGALLLPSEINKERKVILAEMRSRDSADYRTLEASFKFAFPDALISKRLPIGTVKALKNADQNILRNFYQTWYRPENMVVVLVGEFDPKIAQKAINQRFYDMRAKRPRQSKPDFGQIEHQGIQSFYHYEKESGNTTVSIENVVEIERKPDSLSFQKKVLNRYLADLMLQNRMDAMLKDPKIPFTSADIGSGQYFNKVQYAKISAETKADNWDNSLIKLENTLRRALIYGFLPSELRRVKNDFRAELINGVKEASTRDSRDLAERIISHINTDRVLQSPQQELDIFGPIAEKITVADVNKAFRSVWSADHRLLSVTGNARLGKGLETQENSIRAAYDKSLKSAVLAPKKLSTVTFPYLATPKNNGKIISRKHILDLGIEQIDFSNGLRLNLKKTDFERNQVTVNVDFGYGRSSEPADAAGISELAPAVVNASGLGRLSDDELQTALAGKTSRVSFKVKEENFLITGSTVSDELPLMFQLIYAHLLDPGFRESAYRLSLERLRQRDQAMMRSVDGVMSMSGERFLAGGDSRFGSASYDELKKISLKRIEHWIKKGYETTPLEVSIVGDFDTKEVVELVSRYLGGLPKKTKFLAPKRTNKIDFPKNRSAQFKVESRIPKSLIVVAYPTNDFWDIHQTRRMSALADLLSERLRVYIREEMGAAYSPFAYHQAFRAYPGYGMLKAQIVTKPEQALTVADAVKTIAQQIYAQPISTDELNRIIDPLVTSIKDLRRTNGYWLNTVLTLSKRHPQQLEWSRTMAKDYPLITKEDLLALSKKYLKKETAATVIVLPKD
jgi:zinc protease